MNRSSSFFLVLLLLWVAAPVWAQKNTNESAFRAAEDSLKITDMFSRNHHPIEYLENDVAFGGTFGTPGGLNVIAEGYYNRFGLRMECGGALVLFALIAGYQLDFSYVLLRSTKSLCEASLIYSRTYLESVDNNGEWHSGLGAGISINAGGFFVQISLGHTLVRSVSGYVDSSPALINSWPMTFQIGYVH